MLKLTKDSFQALIVATALLMLSLPGSAQTENRVVHVLYPNECPVQILNFRVAEIGIEPQRPFEAEEGWLKDLSWEIENSSEKTVANVEIDLDFHGLADRGESVFKYLCKQKRNASGEDTGNRLVMPGERARISISNEEFETISRFVEGKQSRFTVSVVEMKISKVVFEDGTTWPQAPRLRKQSKD